MVDSLHISSQLAYLRVRGIYRHFQQASLRNNIPIALLLAIASRESGMGLSLDANWTGDNGNGIGIMQIDRRYHSDFTGRFANNDHQANIDYGAEFLSGLIRQFPGDRTAAVAAYNAGASRVRSALVSGLPPDAVTTGRDYGSDVIERMNVIESILGASKKSSFTAAAVAMIIAGFASYKLLTQNN
jgi:soluble lytic murein transglycosylase-like protein